VADSLIPDTIISGNVIYENNGSGIVVYSAAVGWESIGLTIEGNVIRENKWYGIDINGLQKGITITGNSIVWNKRHGLRIYNSNYTLVSGNTIAYNSKDNPGMYSGIIIDSGFHNTIIGNQVYDGQTNPTQKWGIEEVIDSPQADYNMIVANNAYENQLGGIMVWVLTPKSIFLGMERLGYHRR
jgi:parallel beta-helix repeat protein